MNGLDLEDGAARAQRIAERARELYTEQRERVLRRVDRMFLYLMGGQWAFGILVASITIQQNGTTGTASTDQERRSWQEVR